MQAYKDSGRTRGPREYSSGRSRRSRAQVIAPERIYICIHGLSLRIFVVDDEQVIAQTLAVILRQSRFFGGVFYESPGSPGGGDFDGS
jgi:hypothetical protein